MTTNSIKRSFKNKSLFDKAMTHRSWLNENPEIKESNERLEFLGDAVLELVVSEELYTRLPDKQEGFMTALRANIVNTKNLGAYALKINLGEALLLSRGENDGGGRTNISLLADTVEAVIGAIFIDRGYVAASKFIHKTLLEDLDKKLTEPLKDPKSLLQEKAQSLWGKAPTYKVTSEDGPDHNKTFTVEVFIRDKKVGVGSGKSKSEAEMLAAEAALAAQAN